VEKLIIKKLREQKEYVSGEELSKLLGVSRTAVWKHINDLREEGYEIESSSRKGYKLMGCPDVLSELEIKLSQVRLSEAK
jgi:BirA family biotin operon repressor/biotin-[acetyl-CoA-carboxylase] ligase